MSCLSSAWSSRGEVRNVGIATPSLSETQAPLEDESRGVGDIGGDFDHDLGLDAPDDLDLSPRDLPDNVFPKDYEPSEAGVDNELLVEDGSEPIAIPAPEELDFMRST